MSMNMDTSPSAQTLPGISRQRKRERECEGIAVKLRSFPRKWESSSNLSVNLAPGPPLSRGRAKKLLCRLFLLRRSEAAVEGLVLIGHLDQQLVGRKARAVFLLQVAAQRNELPGAHHVDVGESAAGKRRKAEAEDGANIGLAHVGQDFLLEAARGLQCLHCQQAILQLLHIDSIRIERLRL